MSRGAVGTSARAAHRVAGDVVIVGAVGAVNGIEHEATRLDLSLRTHLDLGPSDRTAVRDRKLGDIGGRWAARGDVRDRTRTASGM